MSPSSLSSESLSPAGIYLTFLFWRASSARRAVAWMLAMKSLRTSLTMLESELESESVSESESETDPDAVSPSDEVSSSELECFFAPGEIRASVEPTRGVMEAVS